MGGKSRPRPMRGLKCDRTARVIMQGHAFMQNVRRGALSTRDRGARPPPRRGGVHRTRRSHLQRDTDRGPVLHGQLRLNATEPSHPTLYLATKALSRPKFSSGTDIGLVALHSKSDATACRNVHACRPRGAPDRLEARNNVSAANALSRCPSLVRGAAGARRIEWYS
jgi:hypothetical protein